jgi:branched-chain amino acid transport system substrate-binding protein
MRRKLQFSGALAVLALVAATAAAGGSSRPSTDPGITKNSILLGGTFPLSGPASAYGVIPRAEAAYFNWFNAHSKINGRKIKWKYYDDGYDPSQTVPQTRRLVEQDHVFAIFNSLGTADNLAVRPYLNQRHVPQTLLATGAVFWGQQYKKYPWTIGWNPDYIGEGRYYAQYIKSHIKGFKIGVLAQNDEYGDNYLKGLRLGLGKQKSKIIVVERYDVTDATVAAQMAKLRASGANVFVDFATPKASIQALIIKAKLAWQAAVVVNSVSSSPSYMRLVRSAAGAGAVDGAISDGYPKDTTDPTQAKDPGVKLFKSIMAKYYPSGDIKDTNNMYAMSAAWTVIYALKHSGKTPTRKSFMRALTHMNTSKDPFLLKGIVVKTTPTDHYPIQTVVGIRWQGDYWHRTGKVFRWR